MRYFDLRVNLDVHPVSGDLMRYTDADAIASQIKNLIFTDFYEVPWKPMLGAGVPQTLFENFGIDTEYEITTRITETINKYVKRAELVGVELKYDGHNGYDCTIVFRPINALDTTTLKIFLRTK